MKLLYGDGKTFSSDFELQAIRLRYRIADIQTKSKDLIKRGFELGFIRFDFSIAKVEEAASAGMVDLYTHWFQPSLKQFNYSRITTMEVTDLTKDETEQTPEIVKAEIRDSKEAYKIAVPPAILIHQ